MIGRGKRVRHILSLSGGKDSTALAIYMKDRIPEMEYVFCDTEKELPETYEYLDLLEAYLGRPIVRLKHDGRGFDHWLELYGNYLPSAQARWCTRHLKIQPFERYVGDDLVVTYIGIRADEDRVGYLSSKPNVRAIYPFKEDGIGREDVRRILIDSGLGLPEYSCWRSRSGCYFCFFQQKIEWVGLLENHPDLFEQARAYEKPEAGDKACYTWNRDETLQELSRPERVAEIKMEHEMRMALQRRRASRDRALIDVVTDDEAFCSIVEAYEWETACEICR